MRKIYLLTSIAALGAAATQCGTAADNPPVQNRGGATASGGDATSGGEATATSGGTTSTSGGATTNGGAPATSGGATSGGNVSGGASGSAGTPTSGGAGSNSGGTAGMAGGGAGGGTSGEAGKAGGGAGGAAGSTSGGASGSSGAAGSATGGAAGSAGAGGTGGAAIATFADVAKILEANCGMFCHKAGNDKGHIVLSNADGMLYTRLTTALTTKECQGAILANPADASKSVLPLIVSGTVSTLGCDNVPRMPNMCSTTMGTPGGNPPNCLSKADIATIQAWVTQGAKGP